MNDLETDLNREMMLDGNALGGMFQEIFATEMTPALSECANCGNIAAMGALLAFTQAPGMVLRCPTCESVVIRIVETPTAIYLDARGAVYVRIEQRAG